MKKKKRLNVCSGIDHALRKYHMQQITIQTIILYVCECILIHHHREKEKITRERVRYERKHHSTMHVFFFNNSNACVFWNFFVIYFTCIAKLISIDHTLLAFELIKIIIAFAIARTINKYHNYMCISPSNEKSVCFSNSIFQSCFHQAIQFDHWKYRSCVNRNHFFHSPMLAIERKLHTTNRPRSESWNMQKRPINILNKHWVMHMCDIMFYGVPYESLCVFLFRNERNEFEIKRGANMSSLKWNVLRWSYVAMISDTV